MTIGGSKGTEKGVDLKSGSPSMGNIPTATGIITSFRARAPVARVGNVGEGMNPSGRSGKGTSGGEVPVVICSCVNAGSPQAGSCCIVNKRGMDSPGGVCVCRPGGWLDWCMCRSFVFGAVSICFSSFYDVLFGYSISRILTLSGGERCVSSSYGKGIRRRDT